MMLPAHITINTVHPAEMRYQTVGDWQVKGDTLVITVADSGDTRTNAIVGIHEAIEAVLFLSHGGNENSVDHFDTTWDHKDYDEAGDDPTAPYHREHVLATIVERMMARDLHMTWEAHNENVERADHDVEKARKKK